MKYLSCLAAIGLTEAKTAFIIDDEKIFNTVTDIVSSVQNEAQTEESIEVAQALQAEIEKAAIKVDLSMNKLVTPILERVSTVIEA